MGIGLGVAVPWEKCFPQPRRPASPQPAAKKPGRDPVTVSTLAAKGRITETDHALAFLAPGCATPVSSAAGSTFQGTATPKPIPSRASSRDSQRMSVCGR